MFWRQKSVQYQTAAAVNLLTRLSKSATDHDVEVGTLDLLARPPPGLRAASGAEGQGGKKQDRKRWGIPRVFYSTLLASP